MKLSKFNFKSYFNGMGVIYNSLSGKFVFFDQVLWDKGFENNEFLLKSMIENHMIVDNQTNEDKLAELKYLDNMYDNILRLTILPTMDCNFRCKYCYEEHKKRSLSEDDVLQIEKFIRKNLSKYNGLFVDWFGGEPLLCKNIVNRLSSFFINQCRKHGKLYFASMTTNGSLLNNDNFNQMLNNRIHSFHITIDGTKENHDFTRPFSNGKGSFNSIINNLRNIRDNSSERFKIILRTNVNKKVYSVLDEYLFFLETEFGNDNRFLFYFRPVGDWGGERVNVVKNSMISDLDELYNKLLTSKHNLNYDFYINLLHNSICNAAYRNSYVIAPENRILKCTCELENELNQIGKFINGDMVLDNNILSKWILKKPQSNNTCSNCSKYAACYANTCPLNRIKGMEYPCGYDNRYLDYILKLLIKNKESKKSE